MSVCIKPFAKSDSPFSTNDAVFSKNSSPFSSNNSIFSKQDSKYTELCLVGIFKIFQDGSGVLMQNGDRYILN